MMTVVLRLGVCRQSTDGCEVGEGTCEVFSGGADGFELMINYDFQANGTYVASVRSSSNGHLRVLQQSQHQSGNRKWGRRNAPEPPVVRPALHSTD
jgi:hypothetical protein